MGKFWVSMRGMKSRMKSRMKIRMKRRMKMMKRRRIFKLPVGCLGYLLIICINTQIHNWHNNNYVIPVPLRH